MNRIKTEEYGGCHRNVFLGISGEIVYSSGTVDGCLKY